MTDQNLNDEVALLFADRQQSENQQLEMAAKSNNDINIHDSIFDRKEEVEEKKTQKVLPICIGKVIAKN